MDSASDSTGSLQMRERPSKSTSTPPIEATSFGLVQPRGFPLLPEDWVSDWEKFTASDGKLQLFTAIHHKKEWKSPQALFILHGMHEHGGRYLHFPCYLNEAVDAVVCLDHRGHGRSEGVRGDAERFDLLAEDAVLAISHLESECKRKFGTSEIHLLGHSMGGLVAIRALSISPELPIKSLTLSAPLLGLQLAVPRAKRMAGRALSILWGGIQMTSQLDPKLMSHDPAVIDAYYSDQLFHHKITPRMFFGMRAAMLEARNAVLPPDVPLQMLIPLADEIVDKECSLAFFESQKLHSKLLKEYEGFFHEPFNEIQKEKAFSDLKLWIKANSNVN